MVVSAGGLGAFSAVDLRKRLAGKVVSVTPSIGRTDETVSGRSSRADLDTLFQLIYLTMTAPRADPAMSQVVTTQLKTLLAHQSDDPGSRSARAHVGAHARQPARAAAHGGGRDERSLDKSLAFYRDRFADASGFTFTFAALRRRRAEAAGRALPGVAAVDRRARDLEGRANPAAPRRGREAGHQGRRAQERDRDCLHRAVSVRRARARRHPRHGGGARDPAAQKDPRGAGRHLRRKRVARLLEGARRGVPPHDRLHSSPAGRPTSSDRVRRNRAVQDRRPDRAGDGRRARGAPARRRDERAAEQLSRVADFAALPVRRAVDSLFGLADYYRAITPR